MKAAEDRAAALAAGDAQWLEALLHERFRWTTHTGQVLDRSEYIHRNTAGDTIWRSQVLADAEVVLVGDTAVLHAEAIDVVLSDGHDRETLRMPMTQVWVRVDGRWRCLAGHAGPRRP